MGRVFGLSLRVIFFGRVKVRVCGLSLQVKFKGRIYRLCLRDAFMGQVYGPSL